MLNQLSPGYLQAIKREHHTIGEKAHQLELVRREAVARNWPISLIRDTSIRLRELEQILQEHFVREEEGGFLDEAVCNSPQYAAESSRLMHEHSEILGRIREMLARSSDRLAADPSLAYPFAKSLEATLRQLLMHETRENVLLKKAFNLDSDSI